MAAWGPMLETSMFLASIFGLAINVIDSDRPWRYTMAQSISVLAGLALGVFAVAPVLLSVSDDGGFSVPEFEHLTRTSLLYPQLICVLIAQLFFFPAAKTNYSDGEKRDSAKLLINGWMLCIISMLPILLTKNQGLPMLSLAGISAALMSFHAYRRSALILATASALALAVNARP